MFKKLSTEETRNDLKLISEALEKVVSTNPLVHNITNYVTVNDCANILLSAGASPIMADAKEEVEEIITICNALNINIGTLNERTIESMVLAGFKANELNKPALLDPVGIGASELRTVTALKLLEEVKFSVVRGNISEIKLLASIFNKESKSSDSKGVDANDIDKVRNENLLSSVELVANLARTLKTVVSVSGEIDLVSDGTKTIVIKNGNKMMTKVCGTGCMLSALITAYIGANDNVLHSTASAMLVMALAGQRSYEKVEKNDLGNMSYRNFIIDEVSKIDSEIFETESDIEVYERTAV